MPTEMVAFAVALVASFTLIPPVRYLALRVGMVDRPDPRKVHLTPVPLLGGLAIYTGVVLATIFFMGSQARAQTVGILAGATLLAVVGILDDRGLLHHQIKLMVAMPVAAVILLASGIRAQLFSAYLPGSIGLALDGCLTVLWVVGVTASFSILDHMDGLCAGVAAVASSFFAVFAIRSGQSMVGILAAAILGASVGFLRWNFNPAKIFMGDAGAMFLGFFMATLSLKLRFGESSHFIPGLIAVLILGVPLFDTGLVIISRARRGLLPFASPGKDHTAHRLANWGLGQRGAVLALYGLGGLSGGLAFLVSRIPPGHSYALATVVVLVALLAVVILEHAPYERQEKPEKSS